MLAVPTFSTALMASNSSFATSQPLQKGLISFAFSDSPTIKLNSRNYLDLYVVDIWFLGHVLYDNLTKKVEDINTKIQDEWLKADY